jgi:hypothetical protein
MKTEVNEWKDGRFAIFDSETKKILDDAQGYGYKTKQNALKAMWYKFKGGKEKKDEEKELFNKWIKENKKVYNTINDYFESAFKEIARGETTIKEIYQEIEEEFNIKIPDYVIKNM